MPIDTRRSGGLIVGADKPESRLRASAPNAELRAVAGDSLTIEGYAVLYNVRSDPIYGRFYEIIAPGAFDRSLRESPDVRCLWNHDDGVVLGRVGAGTLEITTDDRGVWFSCQCPDSPDGRSAHASVKRGDVNQPSFLFRCREDKWTYDMVGDVEVEVRTVLDADMIEVSPVTFPAYSVNESVIARCAEFRSSRKSPRPASRHPDHARAEIELARRRMGISPD